MPDRTIFRKTLRDLRWQVVGWGLGLAGLAAMLVLLYPAIAEQFEGVEMENIGFGEIQDLSDPRQFFQVEFFTWSPVLMTVFAIIAGGALLAGEEGAGTLELLLSAATHPAGAVPRQARGRRGRRRRGPRARRARLPADGPVRRSQGRGGRG